MFEYIGLWLCLVGVVLKYFYFAKKVRLFCETGTQYKHFILIQDLNKFSLRGTRYTGRRVTNSWFQFLAEKSIPHPGMHLRLSAIYTYIRTTYEL